MENEICNQERERALLNFSYRGFELVERGEVILLYVPDDFIGETMWLFSSLVSGGRGSYDEKKDMCYFSTSYPIELIEDGKIIFKNKNKEGFVYTEKILEKFIIELKECMDIAIEEKEIKMKRKEINKVASEDDATRNISVVKDVKNLEIAKDTELNIL